MWNLNLGPDDKESDYLLEGRMPALLFLVLPAGKCSVPI